MQLRDDIGKMLHIKNKKHLERLAKQLLLQVSKENLKLLLTWISWEGIRRPNLTGSWHMDWMNTLHHDPDVYEILVFLLGTRKFWCDINSSKFLVTGCLS